MAPGDQRAVNINRIRVVNMYLYSIASRLPPTPTHKYGLEAPFLMDWLQPGVLMAVNNQRPFHCWKT